MRKIFIFTLFLLGGCAEVAVQGYAGQPKSDSEVSIVRTWSPNLLVWEIDGQDSSMGGRASRAYILPGEHKFKIKLVKIAGYHLLCGAICDSIFNKPQIITATTQAGHAYIFRYVNDEKGTIVLDDKGTQYDPTCLLARDHMNGKNC